MTDTELSQPTLCQRICCCFSSTSKEPPVQLIRSGTLQPPAPAPAPKTNGQHISAAEDTIDGFEDVNLEVRTAAADNSNPRVLVEKASDSFNMNDIMMEEVFREEKPDDGDCVIEDAVSISTNVVEEVDESELSRLRLHSPKETPPPGKKEVEEKPPSEEKSRDNNNEIARRLSLELPSTSKTNATHDHDSATDSDEEDATPTKDNYTVAVTVETKTVEVVTEHPNSPSGEQKEPLGDSQHSATETKQKEDVEQLSEEEVMVEITPTVQKAFEPSIPPKSIMYADTSSDQDSDDEEEREILPPVQRSQKVMNFDKVLDESTVNGKLEVVTTVTTKTLDSTSSDDERSSEDDKKPRKQKNLTVTRIVVRDDGKPDELSSGPVKLSLDGREAITDEEFSEKLI